MGKSPGKWSKTLLFGKKSSKSDFPKGREKVGNEKEVWVAAKAPEADLASDLPVASDLALNTIATNDVKLEENREAANLPLERGILLPGNRDSDTQDTLPVDALKDPDRTRQDQASTKVQVAFRGYLESKFMDHIGVNTSAKVVKLSANTFVHKLFASSPIAMPLRLQHDTTKPNSVLNWLEQWSESHLWEPIPQLKKVPGSKSQKK